MTTTITGNNNANLISTAATTTGNNFQFTPLNDVDVVALEGNDTVLIANNNQLSAATVRGGLGADSIVLGTNTTLNSFVFSGQGNDTVVIGSALNTTVQDLYGNNVYDFTAATSLNLASVQNGDGNDSVRVQGTTQFSTIRGGTGNDTYTLTGNITGSEIFSGQGDDSVSVAGTITDSLIQDIYGTNRHDIATANNSTVIGGDGIDTVQILTAASNGTLIRAADGNDSINIAGTFTNSSVFAGSGNDTVRINGVATNSQFTSETGNNIFYISNGAAYNGTGNVITGSSTSKLRLVINGGGGTAEGFFGSNAIQGITTVTNDAANSQITLGDNAYARGIRIAEALSGNAALITFNTTAATSNVTMLGSTADDTLTSGTASDSLSGGSGNDTLNGANGNNTIIGEDGNDGITTGTGTDTVNGGVGNDTITGGTGADNLTGGTGADEFVQAAGASVVPNAVTLTDGGIVNGNTLSFTGGVDVITDFVSGTDKLNVATANNLTSLFGFDPTGNPLTVNNNYWLRGTWSGTTFTVDNSATAATTNVAVAILADALAADASSLTQNGWIIATGIATVAAADFN